MNRRAVAERQGRRAETIAAWWLRLQGWRILAQRARVPGGEVDLVARRGGTLAFVEVKKRRDQQSADLALDRSRLKRVAVAAERLAPRYGRGCSTIRIDAIFIVPGRWPRHVPDVWSG
ncbi:MULTISPECIES: YraN family protein [Sphingomonas]|uniref:YraN family protein n=1 Tax=Sphingomonas TaxID=13687 RepID=UPI000DEED329|nr:MULTISPECIES: YraN family protein [Sphingomonas]